MSHWAPDFGFEQLKAHRDTIVGAVNTNEANTRLRAIDTILFEVLGWNKLDVDAETYCRLVGYSDYVLKTENTLSVVIEAKRNEIEFVVPAIEFKPAASSFALLARECPEADKALRQASGYAASLGARFVGITNGYQWLIALTFVQNQTMEERSVIVFESLEAIEAKFRLFWDCFSPAGVAQNRAINLLLDTRKAPPPRKLSQRLAVYPAPASRNELSQDLSVVLGAVWEEIKQDEDETEFLKQCYVKPEASTTAIALAKELLEQKLSSDERVSAQQIHTGQLPQLFKEYAPEKPIVVLGNVGSGKTIFLKYLRKIEAAHLIDKYIQIDVDFLDRPATAAEVGPYVYARIEEQLRCPPHNLDLMDDALIRAALNADLNRFKKSPEAKAFGIGSPDYVRAELVFINSIRSDCHEFLKRVFAHLRGSRRYSIALFFDNLDRRPEPIQEEAYLRASAIARDWASLVFVCLRPTTFYKSSSTGVLDSLAPKLIAITSAKADNILVRRLKFAMKYAVGTDLPIRPNRAPLGSTFAFEMPNVALFLECLVESFRHNSKLCELFEAVSNGNTRDLLKYAYSFLTSLHLNTSEILEHFESDPTYRVPVHHALRAILFGNSLHYDPRRSRFINLFDLQQSDPLEHFTRPSVLHYLLTVSTGHPVYGFARLSDLIRHLCHSGYTNSHSVWTVRQLFERKCVESRDPLDDWSDEIKEVRITDLGRYHISVLLNEFNYFDAITVDTPILNNEARGKINDVFAIRARMERCLVFLDYLNEASSNLIDIQVKKMYAESHNTIIERMAVIHDRIEAIDAEK